MDLFVAALDPSAIDFLAPALAAVDHSDVERLSWVVACGDVSLSAKSWHYALSQVAESGWQSRNALVQRELGRGQAIRLLATIYEELQLDRTSIICYEDAMSIQPSDLVRCASAVGRPHRSRIDLGVGKYVRCTGSYSVLPFLHLGTPGHGSWYLRAARGSVVGHALSVREFVEPLRPVDHTRRVGMLQPSGASICHFMQGYERRRLYESLGIDGGSLVDADLDLWLIDMLAGVPQRRSSRAKHIEREAERRFETTTHPCLVSIANASRQKLASVRKDVVSHDDLVRLGRFMCQERTRFVAFLLDFWKVVERHLRTNLLTLYVLFGAEGLLDRATLLMKQRDSKYRDISVDLYYS